MLDALGIGVICELVQAFGHLFFGNALFFCPIGDRSLNSEIGLHRLVESAMSQVSDKSTFGMARDKVSSTTLARKSATVWLERILRHHLTALLEYDLALVVHHVVVFEDVLADIEVARFDLLLRLFERLV